ncbi:alpha/beta-hydrolase [Aspergillus falconensis]
MARDALALTKIQFLVTLLFYVIPHAALRIPSAIVRAWSKKLPLGPAIWNGFAGALMVNTPPKQLQAILPSTIATYNAWVSSCGAVRAVDVLPADKFTRLLWIGPRRADRVILFFHGGGYVMPLSEGHLEWMAHTRTEAANVGIELSVCILEYDLIPAHPYPRQMTQGILALKHLLTSGYKPSDIIFGGDSAGGHLSLSLIAHLHRNRPCSLGEESAIDLQTPVKGCFLVSPLASFDFNSPSYRTWFSADVLSRRVVDKWGRYLADNSPWHREISAGNGWGMALDVPESWWDGFHAVDNIVVTGGYEEVFSDHVQQLGAMLKRKSRGEVVLYMGNEAHDGPLMDFSAGRPPSKTSRVITDFVIDCFKQ